MKIQSLFTKLKWDETALNNADSHCVKSFIEVRDSIGKVFFGVFVFVYAVLWIEFNKVQEIPVVSFYLTLFMIPVLLYSIHMRAFHYLFIHHWIYVLYYIATGTIFFLALASINTTYKAYGYVFFELGHLLIANVLGVLIGILMSVPFKFIQWFLYVSDKIYYDTDVLMKIDEKIYPEKKQKELEKHKQQIQYENMNETELNAELNSAIKEDRFEDAADIRKVLDRKFR